MTLLLALLLAVLVRLTISASSVLIGWLAWLLRPTHWMLLLGYLLLATPSPVHAGWLWGPDPKVEAANQALERAAQIATDAARTQTSQQAHFLDTLTALSNERTQLAGHLKNLGELASRDSAWASALSTSGPVLVSVAVLGVAGVAIWLSTRAGSHDAQLASVLVDELAGPGPLLLGQHTRGPLHALGYTRGNSSITNNDPEQEMPF